ncbi:YnjH family protein [Photobacterium rosenbergii]|uniref:YnjH family protein n=1 Tax=Photobacterium rosenbergii TaxID=294936 RepID=UPI0021BDD33A|nr:YnjH family protein [Photobacterium rosenbergii]
MKMTRCSRLQAFFNPVAKPHFLIFWVSLLTALLLSQPLMAKEISVRSQPKVSLEGTFNTQRVCFYNGQSYSLGSVISVEGVLLECLPEKHFETNGALKWVRVEKKS